MQSTLHPFLLPVCCTPTCSPSTPPPPPPPFPPLHTHTHTHTHTPHHNLAAHLKNAPGPEFCARVAAPLSPNPGLKEADEESLPSEPSVLLLLMLLLLLSLPLGVTGFDRAPRWACSIFSMPPGKTAGWARPRISVLHTQRRAKECNDSCVSVLHTQMSAKECNASCISVLHT